MFALLLWLVALTGPVACLSLWGYAQTADADSASLLGLKRLDRVGPESPKPDGKSDAVFALSLKGKTPAPKITAIEIVSVSGPPGYWSTTRARADARFAGIASSKRPSLILNDGKRPLSVNLQQEGDLLLFVTDDGKFGSADRRFRIKLVHQDGSARTIPVAAAREPSSESPAAPPGAYPVRMSAMLKGISNYDAVNPGETITGDDAADGLFVLVVEAENKEINAIQIKGVSGVPAIWDTVPGNGNNAIGVALESDPARLLNHRDGSVRIRVAKSARLNLYVADNGSIAGGKTEFRITVTFSDGGISWCPVKAVERPAAPPSPPAGPGGQAGVNFLGSWLGYVSTDSVGPYPGMRPDGKADAVFGLDIEISPKSEMTGLEIQSLTDFSRRWATTGVAPGAWGLGIAYQRSPRSLLNKPDGSIDIPIHKRVQFYVYAADPGDMAAPSQRFRMVVHLSDGSAYQQMVRVPHATTSTVVPGDDTGPAARGLITCEFRGFIADLVNTSTRPGKDGYLDGIFLMKLKVSDKTLTGVVIKGADGTIGWSSTPKPPVMFLGVALYPNIYNLVNKGDKPLNIPVSDRKTIYLYAADNGMLSDPNTRLTVEVTFSDKSKLSAPVIK